MVWKAGFKLSLRQIKYVMKNSSVVLNVVLLIAVAYLYYIHFSAPKTVASQTSAITVPVSTDTMTKPLVLPDTSPLLPSITKPSRVVYVNIDALNNGYEFLNDRSKVYKSSQAKMEADYQTMTQKFQQDYQDYQSAAQAGIAPKADLAAKEEQLMKLRDKIGQTEMEVKKLAQEIQDMNEEMYKNLLDYIKEYNKAHDYHFIMAYTAGGGNLLYAKDSLDITNEIVAGMNDRYRRTKKGK